MKQAPLNFTKAALAGLPLPTKGKRTYFKDAKTRGLMFAITDRGTRSYVFYRKIDGRPERILIGRFDELSVDQARDRAAELNAQIAAGNNPADKTRSVRAEMTLGKLFEDFMDRHARVHVKYHAQYEAQFRMYFREAPKGLPLASRQLAKIVRADIAEIHGRMTKNNQPLTANRVLSMISSVFNWAIRAGLTAVNPAQGIKKNPERDHQRDRFLQASEMPSFFQALAAHPSEVMQDYVLLSLLTGQRQANVLAMEWSEIDFANSTWRIPRSKTKTRRLYEVPLVPEVVAILQRRKESTAAFSKYVLPGAGAAGHFAEPKNGWKRIIQRAHLFGLMNAVASADGWTPERLTTERQLAEYSIAASITSYSELARLRNIDPDQFKLADLRMHDLRRTLASWQAITGANLVAISRTLNHSNVATTSIYARMQTDPVRQAISTAAGAMFEAGGLVRVPEPLARFYS